MSMHIMVCKKHGELKRSECTVTRRKGHLTEYLKCNQCAKAYQDRIAQKRNSHSREKYEKYKEDAVKKALEENKMFNFVSGVFDKLTIKRLSNVR